MLYVGDFSLVSYYDIRYYHTVALVGNFLMFLCKNLIMSAVILQECLLLVALFRRCGFCGFAFGG